MNSNNVAFKGLGKIASEAILVIGHHKYAKCFSKTEEILLDVFDIYL